MGIKRAIVHMDLDTFFVSCERLLDSRLNNKPILIGGTSDRGVVASCSYEARKFGVRSAMSSVIAIQNCPDLIFVKSNFKRYHEVSDQIRKIFYEYTDKVEPLSLDEAYLDVTENKKGNPSASLIAKEIRKIRTRTLNDIIENSPYKNQKINYLSIDVEGHEMNVLNGFDINKYKPELVVLEFIDIKIKEYYMNKIIGCRFPLSFVDFV